MRKRCLERATDRAMSDTSPHRIVVKLGTRVLTQDDGRLAQDRLQALVRDVAALVNAGRDVLLVSSGAVGLGRDAMGLPPGPSDLATRQACAAIGQGRLMGFYDNLFAQHGLCCAQVLLTQSDFENPKRYDNLCRTLTTLMRHRAVPIINENDVVATEELAYATPIHSEGDRSGGTPASAMQFGDNDQLASLLAANLDADLLVLLTDVDAVYTKNPNKHPDAEVIREWTVSTRVDAHHEAGAGRGGMSSKIHSATHAARAGCTTVIASGREPGTLMRVLDAEPVGTRFVAIKDGGQSDRDRNAPTVPRGKGATSTQPLKTDSTP